MNRALRLFGERTLIRSGIASVARRRIRDRILVLAYHNVLPHGAQRTGDSSLHLSQADFSRQLDLLAEMHDVIPMAQLHSSSLRSARSRVVITFDDAYVGALTAGIDELVRRQMPATIFVAPGLLGSTPWWDILADPDTGAIPENRRNEALQKFAGDAERILDWSKSFTRQSVQSQSLPRIANEAELERAASRPGISLESHTWSHANLASVEGSRLESELERPIEWLRARFSREPQWLSYPYGISNQNVESVAARVGYMGSFRIDGGWLPRGNGATHRMPRLNIPAGLSLDGFRLRLAGMF